MNLDLAKSLDRLLGSALGSAVGAFDALRAVGRPPTRVEEIDRILVMKFWGLGNWALLRPLVGALRDRYPRARLTIATLASNAPLVQDLADRLLLVRTDSTRSTVCDLLGAVRFLRQTPHELGLDFEQFSRTGALLGRLGAVQQRIGFRSGGRGRDGLYTVTVPFLSAAHVTRSFRNLVEAAGVAPAPYEPGGLEPTARAHASLNARFGRTRGAVVLHPGSGDNFTGRRWSAAGFAAVGRAAVARGVRVWVTGGASEATLAEGVVERIGTGATSLAGRLTLHELVALLAGARVVVSNDTGPVHLASQLGVPVLAIYGPNTPVRYGPLSPGSHAFYRELPCSPCLTNESYRSSRCRIHTCMDSIPTGTVVAALDRLLSHDGVAAAGGGR